VPDDKLLTRQEVADMFSCSVNFVAKQEAKGEWPRVTNMGYKALYSKRLLDAWLDANRGVVKNHVAR